MFINGFDILWDEIDDYVADIQSIRSIDQFMFIYSILYNPCIFKAYRLLNVQT